MVFPYFCFLLVKISDKYAPFPPPFQFASNFCALKQLNCKHKMTWLILDYYIINDVHVAYFLCFPDIDSLCFCLERVHLIHLYFLYIFKEMSNLHLFLTCFIIVNQAIYPSLHRSVVISLLLRFVCNSAIHYTW